VGAGAGRHFVKRARILLADDHRLMAEGLKRLLDPEFELVGIVEDGRALVEAAERLEPDVIVADIGMPRLNGLEAIALLRKNNPNTRVVVITMHRETAYARRALQAGASGFVLKSSAPGELIDAIHAALAGRTFVTPEIAGELAPGEERSRRAGAYPAMSLTPRQREILQLLAAGKTAKEIAALLNVSARTVEFHKYKMMEALGLRTGAELVRFALERGIAPS
jgi:DNA-binding NarL/FixJ family response regulator